MILKFVNQKTSYVDVYSSHCQNTVGCIVSMILTGIPHRYIVRECRAFSLLTPNTSSFNCAASAAVILTLPLPFGKLQFNPQNEA